MIPANTRVTIYTDTDHHFTGTLIHDFDDACDTIVSIRRNRQTVCVLTHRIIFVETELTDDEMLGKPDPGDFNHPIYGPLEGDED